MFMSDFRGPGFLSILYGLWPGAETPGYRGYDSFIEEMKTELSLEGWVVFQQIIFEFE